MVGTGAQGKPLAGGQRQFQVQAFPFRMTAANMARYRDDPNFEFWKMLKEGYDRFEVSRVPPKVDVCGKQYVFNRGLTADGKPVAACGPQSAPQVAESAVALELHQQGCGVSAHVAE